MPPGPDPESVMCMSKSPAKLPHSSALSKLNRSWFYKFESKKINVECDSLCFYFSIFWKQLLKQISAEVKATWNLASPSILELFVSVGIKLNQWNASSDIRVPFSILSSTIDALQRWKNKSNSWFRFPEQMSGKWNFSESRRETIKTSSPLRRAFRVTFCSGFNDIEWCSFITIRYYNWYHPFSFCSAAQVLLRKETVDSYYRNWPITGERA